MAPASGGVLVALALVLSACGTSSAVVNPRPPTSSSVVPSNVAPTPSGTEARTAAAIVPYVKGLVATGRLPDGGAVRRVWADGAIIVLSTTLTDHAAAEDLYERLSTAVGCDDSSLFVKGYRVVLQDGSPVTAPRRGYQTCSGT